MKKIHFDPIDSKENKILLLITIIGLILILLVEFECFSFGDVINRRIQKIFFFFVMIRYSKIFWYRNYFRWNKIGGNIKINKFLPKNFTFDNIKNVAFESDKLTIEKYDGDPIVFSTAKIAAQSLIKLEAIFSEFKVSKKS